MTDAHRDSKHNGERRHDTQPQSALERARGTAAESIDANPLGILVGGLAVGALAGSLIPRSDKEKELLAPVGKRIGDGARAAVSAAKEAGRSELETRGFTADAGREQVKNLLGGLGKALSTASAAAVKSARGQADANASATERA
ncbi:MAG: hypothetical protein JO157_18815 [Acetobacteraceae bacterium]|nr:hypothetical protein [Acetobacteraceae bacterium]